MLRILLCTMRCSALGMYRSSRVCASVEPHGNKLVRGHLTHRVLARLHFTRCAHRPCTVARCSLLGSSKIVSSERPEAVSDPDAAELSESSHIDSATNEHQEAKDGALPSSTSSLDDVAKTESKPLVLGLEEGAAHSAATPLLASISVVAGVVILIAGGYFFKDHIKSFLDFFIAAVDDWGVWGYVAYALVYTGLEVLAVPAIPLTMTAGIIFGPVPGTIIVSMSATAAATIAFLIARYAARDKVKAFASKSPKFNAIDKAIGRDGFKFVTLLRLSPLLPLAASNYIYGLTSVDLGSYVLGSFLGMLPGTYAYVSAGHVGRAVLAEGELVGFESWQVVVGLVVTLIAIGFVGNVAKKALDEVEQEASDKDQA